MDPPNKRRRLAPKVAELPPPHSAPQAAPPTTASPVSAAAAAASMPTPTVTPQQAQFAAEQVQPSPPERHEFESFARHLQDAAMHIYGKMQRRPPYKNASVLLLRWDEDTAMEREVLNLEKVFRERYNYHTDKWAIPTCPNPSIKLSVQMASFIEHARSDHLLIIYYAGHSYVGPDKQVYWASNNTREDACRLKWGGVRCLFEDAQSDILLLLDTCAVHDSPHAGSHGTKQAIAAYSPGQPTPDYPLQSFTSYLATALHNLSSLGRPYTVQRLYDEILRVRQRDVPSRSVNGGRARSQAPAEKTPVLFTLTPGKVEHIALYPFKQKGGSSAEDPHHTNGHSSQGLPFVTNAPVPDLTFDEARVLVCTTFVGDASSDMAFYNQWLQHPPALASKITMEGMFLGPPTMLLVSMPITVWNVVQHDKVCCFLGYINSHNMIDLYKGLVQSSPQPRALSSATALPVHERAVDDGRVHVETRNGGQVSKRRHDSMSSHTSMYPLPAQPVRHVAPARNPLPNSAPVPPTITMGPATRNDVDSAEMKEAAEQLKALSHVRQASDGAVSAGGRSEARSGRSPSSNDANDLMDGYVGAGTPARKPLAKGQPKYDTQCSMCTHAPFKDSSSLRKHIAAAHTRPFPCAFSFAGCMSTFGSKNEWKRHISSQHLCLQYYRCSQCPSSAAEGKGNEFNRKDLFTQHLRRMHAPFAIKKALTKGDSKLESEWGSHVREMHVSCLVTRREPPEHVACPTPDCMKEFEGHTAWDEWTEHVGRHMEKGDGLKIGVDNLLAKWALAEGIIEQTDNGEYKFATQEDTNTFSIRRDSVANTSLVSDRTKSSPRVEESSSEDSRSEADENRNSERDQKTKVEVEVDDPDSIVVATSTPTVHDRMDTDD
ncbi:hypothetical protein M406DRAFT_268730 [Cryphonectria parasitica EP155]|uniref:C2H2-type domain-containing protein n=1 Tax=Cryphonectria parasitica (strain ATCC 38755 / EP155) TaxID=660469 RepID=A0A9P5CKG5_CRYP1|nr:uncharacterized protein M406DRAFT_268730 [Cryphonectria parasitica EP155]KAF3760745.1 hypothetical protein M406DRAFT_268730 [Cryphonectria parasitica EP155]